MVLSSPGSCPPFLLLFLLLLLLLLIRQERGEGRGRTSDFRLQTSDFRLACLLAYSLARSLISNKYHSVQLLNTDLLASCIFLDTETLIEKDREKRNKRLTRFPKGPAGQCYTANFRPALPLPTNRRAR
jgi:hypothetical protein